VGGRRATRAPRSLDTLADSSPLHYLILLEQAEILRHLYGNVVIPLPKLLLRRRLSLAEPRLQTL
jgi:hypothetical protein